MQKKTIFTRLFILVSLIGGSYTHAAALDKTQSTASSIEKISYALGHEFSSQVPDEVDFKAFVEGLRAGYTKQPNPYTQKELQEAYHQTQMQLEKKQKSDAIKAAAVEEKFLSENAKKPGIVTTKSGLQYKIIQKGKGKRPTTNSIVTVHYKGLLLDGTEFDSSYKRNEPIEFPLDQVIPGWTEGLQLMQEGSKATLYVPSKLAYGSQNTGPIPANSTLIFDVELIKVQ